MLGGMKQLAILAVFSALLFAAIAAGLLASRPADHTLRVAELELQLQSANQEIAKLKAELAKPKPTPVTAPGRSGTSSDSGLADALKANGDGPGKPSAMAKMFQDPKMRDMVKAQQGMQIEMQYAKLIGKLSLDDTEASHFKKLLSDRLSAKTDMGFKMMDPSMTAELRKKVSAEYDAQTKANDAAIKQFLNDDNDFNTFKHWEDTEPERMQMMMGRGAFDAVSAPLSAEQEEQLIDLMAKVRKSPSDIPDWNNPKNIDPSKMTDDFAKRAMVLLDQQQKSVHEGAAGFLSPPQLDGLKKFQDQMRTMTEAGMKMGKAMMGK